MGFSVSKLFPGRFVRGEDVVGLEVPLVIRDVRLEKVFTQAKNKEEEKLVVYFEGKDKGVLLGKTRAMDIKSITGSDDTDNWKGKTVCMYVETKTTTKKTMHAIRFKKSPSAE